MLVPGNVTELSGSKSGVVIVLFIWNTDMIRARTTVAKQSSHSISLSSSANHAGLSIYIGKLVRQSLSRTNFTSLWLPRPSHAPRKIPPGVAGLYDFLYTSESGIGVGMLVNKISSKEGIYYMI